MGILQFAFLSYMVFEPDHAVSSEQWQTQMETEQPQFRYCLCIKFVVVTTISARNV